MDAGTASQMNTSSDTKNPNDSKKKPYMIHNYTDDTTDNSTDFHSWKQKVDSLTVNKTVVEWHTYRTPLKTLGFLGRPVMQLFSISPFYAFFTLILPIFLPLPFSFPKSFCISLLLSLLLSCFHHFFSNHKLSIVLSYSS